MSITKKLWNSREFGNSRAAFGQHFLNTFAPGSNEFEEIAADVASDLLLPPDTDREILHQKCSTFRGMWVENDAPCHIRFPSV